uniref:Activin types I and II receptor domain-containing protein n=1 Tax=Parascaris univalens TaxID=6257 RepID=A0A915AQ63_PARUN
LCLTMGVRVVAALLLAASAFALNCWQGTEIASDTSINRNITISDCSGNASYCLINLNATNGTTEKAFNCDFDEQCKSDGWKDEILYCCGADLCNENTNSASSSSLQVFTAGSVLLTFAFRFSH